MVIPVKLTTCPGDLEHPYLKREAGKYKYVSNSVLTVNEK